MTKPTNVLLDPSLRVVASGERGLSLSACIRELFRSGDAAARASATDITPLIGIMGSEGPQTDIARDKHRMVAEAFNEDFERHRGSRPVRR